MANFYWSSNTENSVKNSEEFLLKIHNQIDEMIEFLEQSLLRLKM